MCFSHFFQLLDIIKRFGKIAKKELKPLVVTRHSTSQSLSSQPWPGPVLGPVALWVPILHTCPFLWVLLFSCYSLRRPAPPRARARSRQQAAVLCKQERVRQGLFPGRSLPALPPDEGSQHERVLSTRVSFQHQGLAGHPLSRKLPTLLFCSTPKCKRAILRFSFTLLCTLLIFCSKSVYV